MLTEEQLEEARIELERRRIEKNATTKCTPQIEDIEELYHISHFEVTEAGEFWDKLYEFRRCEDFLSASFVQALDKEINRVIKEVKENYLVVVDSDGEVVDLEYVD